MILSPYFVDGSVYVSPTHLFIGTGPDPAAEPDPVWQLEVARREARHAIRQGFAERTLDGMTISILAWLGETATPPSLTKGEDIYRRIAGKAT